MSGVVHGCNQTPARCAAGYGISVREARFRCARCKRWCGYCFGCSDDMPELCDDCWCDVTRARARRQARALARRRAS